MQGKGDAGEYLLRQHQSFGPAGTPQIPSLPAASPNPLAGEPPPAPASSTALARRPFAALFLGCNEREGNGAAAGSRGVGSRGARGSIWARELDGGSLRARWRAAPVVARAVSSPGEIAASEF
jgi:hypothetical protein